jgi:putative membrane protein
MVGVDCFVPRKDELRCLSESPARIFFLTIYTFVIFPTASLRGTKQSRESSVNSKKLSTPGYTKPRCCVLAVLYKYIDPAIWYNKVMKIITRIAITALALLIVAKLPIGVEIEGLTGALIAAVVLGILNTLVRPLLVILTLPITILTLGLFILVINASLFYLTATFIDGFAVASFWSALLGSVLVSIISSIANKFID